MSEFKLQLGINKCTNREYHSDLTYLSSSNFKLLLTDRKQFYEERILGNRKPQAEANHFDEGSYVHSLILEPEQIEHEYAFFSGFRKAGADWEQFKAENSDKVILSEPQRKRCEFWYEAHKKRPEAMELIQGGESEHTICAMLDGIAVKVRTDYINIDKGYIVDVKTSGFAIDVENFRLTIKQWGYDLSAALYLAVVEQHYGKRFEFYFDVLAKKEQDCQVYLLSDETRAEGQRKLAEAIAIYKECTKTGNWENPKVEIQTPFQSSSDYEILAV